MNKGPLSISKVLRRVPLAMMFALTVSTITVPANAQTQPPHIVAQAGDRGPAILVPTDVTGNRIDVVEQPASVLKIRFENFPDKFNCKKCLIQEDDDTKFTPITKGVVNLESGKILVAPFDGRLLVQTKLAEIAVPKDGIALIHCENNRLFLFNLAGPGLVVHFSSDETAPHKRTTYDECVGLDEGFGIISNGTKDSIASGILQYVGSLASASVVIAVAMKDCRLVVIDPMTLLEHDSIMKSLTKKWLAVLQKVEDTADRVGVWHEETTHHRR